MTRTIRLSKIHALYWYGYQDSIPIERNALLAGLTGSGKSVLMDLIQFVLVGDQRLIRFNQSATGDRSDRTLKGYCLGDTKQEKDGVTEYMRKSAISYVALEFAWPNNQKQETWGIRIEFVSAAENQGKITPFFFPKGLQRSDFLDASKRPLAYAEFKALAETSAGRLYTEGLDPYLRDMAQPVHLNFDREALRALLPSAMSFTFLRSFNDFCRQFILSADKLDVTDVTMSYRTFQAYERELRDLNDQLKLLQEINGNFQHWKNLQRDAALARYLAAQLKFEDVSEHLKEQEQYLLEIAGRYRAEEVRLNELELQLPDLEEKLKSLVVSIGASSEGQLFQELKSRSEILNSQIAGLLPVGKTVHDALKNRIAQARSWVSDYRALPLDLLAETVSSVERSIKQLEDGGVELATVNLKQLSSSLEAAAKQASLIARSDLDHLSEVQRKINQLQLEINALRMGRLPFPTGLLSILLEELPVRGSQKSAYHLAELCEVNDESWRAAIEIAFARKFAVVVSEEDYEQAEKIYHGLSLADLKEGGRESLINPAKALKLPGAVKHGSLAEKINTTHPVATAIVRHFFGELMCVTRREDLRKYNLAILPDGFQSRGAFIERTRFYDQNPFIGKRGLEQQLAWKARQLSELKTDERRLTPLNEAIRTLNERLQTSLSTSHDLHHDLAKAARLPEIQAELAAVRGRIDAIDRSKFEDLVRKQNVFEAEIKNLRTEERKLRESNNRRNVELAEQAVEKSRNDVERLRVAFLNVQAGYDVSPWAEQITRLRTETLAEYPSKDAASDQLGDRANTWLFNAAETFGNLKVHRTELRTRYPKFEELSVDSESNSGYEKQLQNLENSEIPDYADKSAHERQRWEGLFRTQVLEKLNGAIRTVIDFISLLNSSLKQRTIGTNKYQLRYRQNPDFKVYHELLEANSLAREDTLFFATAEPRLKEAIEHFLQLLTDKADSAETARLLDYRNYYDYDMEVLESDGRTTSVDRHSGKFSGGENQSPYFIAILASYLRAYRRYSSKKQDPSLGLVPIDEAFSKLSGERIKDCIDALKAFDLQGVFSMSTGNIPYAMEHCDWLVVVAKEEHRLGNRTQIRNIPVSLACNCEEAFRIMHA